MVTESYFYGINYKQSNYYNNNKPMTKNYISVLDQINCNAKKNYIEDNFKFILLKLFQILTELFNYIFFLNKPF